MVFALLLLPNRPRLDCHVSGLVPFNIGINNINASFDEPLRFFPRSFSIEKSLLCVHRNEKILWNRATEKVELEPILRYNEVSLQAHVSRVSQLFYTHLCPFSKQISVVLKSFLNIL